MTSSSSKVCFNSNCKDVLEVAKQGWLCRTGELADLCYRCSSAFKDGKFCDTYHSNASGWRCCETCGKKIHCGCIVSFHMFVLLDAGGIECLNCAKSEYILTPNPTWPSASNCQPGPAERIRDISSKNWRSISGSGPIRQAPSLFNAPKAQPALQSRTPFEINKFGNIDKPLAREQLTSCSLRKSTTGDPSERSVLESWRSGASEMIRDRDRATGVQYAGQHNLFKEASYQSFFHANATPLSSLPATFVENGLKSEIGKVARVHAQRPCPPPLVGKLCSNSNGAGTFLKAQTHNATANATPLSSLPATFVGNDQKSGKGKVSGVHAQRPCPPPLVGKLCSNSNGAGAFLKAQTYSANAQDEASGRPQLLPRYWPRITDQEKQQISGSSNAKITPLFEKVLSASDVSRIGRIVLPKNCAEAYLPRITQPEGYPLVFQDLKGKDWVLQYRFWTNNHRRMYVLEGVTPCIQSMQLQAGDSVTFSRLDPEGKLVIGYRKVYRKEPLTSPLDHGNETMSTRISTYEEHSKDSIAFMSTNPDVTWSEADTISNCAKRKKVDNIWSNNKHLKQNEQEIIELNITLEQVQGLLLPPLTNASTIVYIEGVEFEDFQEAPIIGSPANCSTNNVGSLSSTEVEPTPERLERMLPMINSASSKNDKSEDPEQVRTLESLDGLADLGSSHATIRHPFHKPGCMCVICVQPPNGNKHKSSCTCNVCLALKRSTDQKCSEKQVGNYIQTPTQFLYADVIQYAQTGNTNQNQKAGASGSFENNQHREKLSTSSFKSQNIDLNIQPEREEDFSPVSDSIGIMRLVQQSTQRYMRQQNLSINGNTDGYHENHAL